MTGNMRVGAAVLIVFALFIWLRDPQWSQDLQDTLPCLLAFPTACWLGRPWSWRETSRPLNTAAVAGCSVLCLSGIAFDSTFILAATWTWASAIWLKTCLDDDAWTRVRPLLLVVFLGFPWIFIDGQTMGWWFRLTGANAVGTVFRALGVDVKQQGTSLLIQGMPMDVEPACGGMNTLQSLLLGGVAMAYVSFGHTRRFWLNLPLLLPAAWIANTLRLIVICGSGLTYGVPFAMGVFHKTGGWLVTVIAFAGLCALFSLQTQEKKVAAL